MFNYLWGAVSPNDPNRNYPLRYHTEEQAKSHADTMTKLVEDTWDENPNNLWNKEYWKVKPLPWIYFKLDKQ
jgi:hypothetical protein